MSCFLLVECGEVWFCRGQLPVRHPFVQSPFHHPKLIACLFSTVSNEVPEHPCVSPVSNHVYERRLIEKYIAENGTDPINNQPLSEEQLIDIKGAWWLASVQSF